MAPAAIPPAAPEPQTAPAALTVCVLASGSRGNAIYVADAIGYTGSIGVQLYKDLAQSEVTLDGSGSYRCILECGLAS